MSNTEYKLIPMNEIDEDARNIAILWCEGELSEYNWIGHKHKLASDFMNYARVKNQKTISSINEIIRQMDISLNDAQNLIDISEYEVQKNIMISAKKIIALYQGQLKEITQ